MMQRIKVLLLVILLVNVAQNQVTMNLDQSMFTQGLRDQFNKSIQGIMQYNMYNNSIITVSKSGAFFYSAKFLMQGWNVKSINMNDIKIEMLKKNNGTLRVSIPGVSMNVTSTYQQQYWVQWLNNQTGTAQATLNMDLAFEYKIGIDQVTNSFTLNEASGLVANLTSTSMIFLDTDVYQMADSFLAIFNSYHPSQILASFQDRLSVQFIPKIKTYLINNINSKILYPVPQNQQYRVKLTLTNVAIKNDGALSVVYADNLFQNNIEIMQNTSLPYTTNSLGKDEIMSYQIDSGLTGALIQAVFNYNNNNNGYFFTDANSGKLFSKYNLTFDYDTMNKYFNISSQDKTWRYQLKVNADQTSTKIYLDGQVPVVNYNIKVELLKDQGYNPYLSSSRYFIINVDTRMKIDLSGSILSLIHISTKAKTVTLYKNNIPEPFDANDNLHYVTYFNLFVMWKQNKIDQFFDDINIDLQKTDLFNPLPQLTNIDRTQTKFNLQFVDTSVVIAVNYKSKNQLTQSYPKTISLFGQVMSNSASLALAILNKDSSFTGVNNLSQPNYAVLNKTDGSQLMYKIMPQANLYDFGVTQLDSFKIFNQQSNSYNYYY